MSIVEFDKPKHPVLVPDTKGKDVEPGIKYPTLAAEILVTEYLAEKRPYLVELAERENASFNIEDGYLIGKMQARKKILSVLWTDLNNPLSELKPVSQNEIEELLKLYSLARKASGLTKSVRTITPKEARARGQMKEFAKSLLNLGQRDALNLIDEKIADKTFSQRLEYGELQ